MTVDLFSDSACTVAEGPRWNSAESTLYWVDITAGEVLRQRGEAAKDGFERFMPGLGRIGAVEFALDGRLLLFTERCEVYISDFGGKPELACRLPGRERRRFNDVLNVGGGVFFCGVAPENPGGMGELWRCDFSAAKFDVIEPSVAGMPNGMGLSSDRQTLFFIVSDERTLYSYDFDNAAKSVSKRHVVCRDFAEPGVPDGMCVDPKDGSLYVAVWNGYRLEHRSSEGALLETIGFPMAKVTSACFGEDCVYVTTGNLPRDESECVATKAGGVFVLRREKTNHGAF